MLKRPDAPLMQLFLAVPHERQLSLTHGSSKVTSEDHHHERIPLMISDPSIFKKDLWEQTKETGASVLKEEAETLLNMAENLDLESFGKAVDLLGAYNEQAIITGMGKSGHIARKIAATLASTGTPAFFVHPAEGLHGDLGMITSRNVVLALSQSGASDEILNLLPYIKRQKSPLIAVTGREDSELAKQADVVLLTKIDREVCPLNLAPTTSTTAQLALGDALAVSLMKRRGFTKEDYAIRHPLGALGRRLLVKVGDMMHSGEENPITDESTSLADAIKVLSSKRMGAISIVSEAGVLQGIFTDGDLGRLFSKSSGQIDTNVPIGEFMIRNPKSISPETLGVKAVDLMESWNITALPVLDKEKKPVGMIHLHDLIKAGITH